jgi:hypothetical protein
LKDFLSVNSRFIKAIAYQKDKISIKIGLNFQVADQLIPANTLALYQNQPFH